MLISRALPKICLQETHRKDEFLQAIQVLVTQFRMFGTFTPNNVNAGGSAILVRTKPPARGCDSYLHSHLQRA